MANEKTPDPKNPDTTAETPFEMVAGYCAMFVVVLFIFTFLTQNFVIPSGSMEDTLLVGDHLVVDRITLAPPAKWMPLVHYREPRRGDIIVFIKPVRPGPGRSAARIRILVKRLIGVPGDHIRLRDGIVILNGVAQSAAPCSTDHAGESYGLSGRVSLHAPSPSPAT